MTGWRVPGRLEVLGKHTDYAGGRVLVCAVERGLTVHGAPGKEGVRARSAAFPGQDVVLRAGEDPRLPPGHWGRYVQTVIDRLTLNFGRVAPAELEFSHDLPPASGMSSSSALLSATALTLADLSGLPETELWRRHCPDRLALAGYLAAIENGGRYGDLDGWPGVGTSGGSLDHTGMLASETGQISYVQFDPTTVLDRVPMPSGWVFVVAMSGVLAEKTGAARDLYNRGPETLKAFLGKWNGHTGRCDTSLQQALETVGGEALIAVADDGYEHRRVRQFVQESGEYVPRAHEALRAGDVDTFGAIVDASQREAVVGLENEIPETAALVALAHELGAVTASSFGAGFGGSVWSMVHSEDADGYAKAWLERYRQDFDHPQATTIITGAASPGERLA